MKNTIRIATIFFGAISAHLFAGIPIKTVDGKVVDCASIYLASTDGLLVSTETASGSKVLAWGGLDIKDLEKTQPEIHVAYESVRESRKTQVLFLGEAKEMTRPSELRSQLREFMEQSRRPKKKLSSKTPLTLLQQMRDAIEDKERRERLDIYQKKRGFGIEQVLIKIETLIAKLPPETALKRNAEEQTLIDTTRRFAKTARGLLQADTVTKDDQRTISDFLKLLDFD